MALPKLYSWAIEDSLPKMTSGEHGRISLMVERRLGVEIKLETRDLNEYSKTRLNSARTRTIMSQAKLAFLALSGNKFNESSYEYSLNS
jgi:hypothetical protein